MRPQPVDLIWGPKGTLEEPPLRDLLFGSSLKGSGKGLSWDLGVEELRNEGSNRPPTWRGRGLSK